MMSVIYVAAGGAVGAVLRYGVGRAATSWFGLGFPYGTLMVNILGSLLMGVFIGLMAKYQASHQALHLFVAIGLLGGFTTFSSFSLDVVSLAQRGEMTSALLYAAGSLVLSVLALCAGLYMVRQL